MSEGAPLLERAFDLKAVEGESAVEQVEGCIPDFVRGTYYSNGPGCYQVGSVRYRHLLDGDGMVRSLRFSASGVRFACRFVHSAKRSDEQEAGRALYRTFGTRFPGDRLNRYGVGIESAVNVSVWRWAGRLLAFGEQGLPYELDPVSLETRGRHTFGGALNEVSPFSAHPKLDPSTGEMFNFGMSFSGVRPTLNLYRFGAEGRLTYRRRLSVPDPCSLHDFALSPSYALFYLNPHVLSIEDLREGGQTVFESLSWEPERGSSLLVASRSEGRAVARIPLGESYCLHTVGAFEEEDGTLVLDVVELEEPVYGDYEVIPDIFDRVRPARPARYRIDARSWEVLGHHVLASELAHDFPAIDPRRTLRRNQHAWVMSLSATGAPGRKYFDQLTHVDLSSAGPGDDVYRLPPKCYFGSEPTCIPDPGDPSGGLVLCKRFDAESERDAYLLFDARRVAGGPVAVLHLADATPPCFHGSWVASPPAAEA